MKRLNNNCVKIVDSDITEDTCWRKHYTYVITQNINVTEGVLLKIENGTKVYLVNDYLVNEQEQLRGGLNFDKARLCAKHLWVSSVNYDGEYFYPSQYSDAGKKNFGVNFNGTKASPLLRVPTFDDSKELSKKVEEHLCKCYLQKEKSNAKCLYKLESISLSYVAYLGLGNLESNELCVKNINLCNLYGLASYVPGFSLYNSSVSVCNLKYRQVNLYSNNSTYRYFGSNIIGLRYSTLIIKKELNALGLDTLFDLLFPSLESKVILYKGVKYDVSVNKLKWESTLICPSKNNLGPVNQSPYCVNNVLCNCVKLYEEEPSE